MDNTESADNDKLKSVMLTDDIARAAQKVRRRPYSQFYTFKYPKKIYNKVDNVKNIKSFQIKHEKIETKEIKAGPCLIDKPNKTKSKSVLEIYPEKIEIPISRYKSMNYDDTVAYPFTSIEEIKLNFPRRQTENEKFLNHLKIGAQPQPLYNSNNDKQCETPVNVPSSSSNEDSIYENYNDIKERLNIIYAEHLNSKFDKIDNAPIPLPRKKRQKESENIVEINETISSFDFLEDMNNTDDEIEPIDRKNVSNNPTINNIGDKIDQEFENALNRDFDIQDTCSSESSNTQSTQHATDIVISKPTVSSMISFVQQANGKVWQGYALISTKKKLRSRFLRCWLHFDSKTFSVSYRTSNITRKILIYASEMKNVVQDISNQFSSKFYCFDLITTNKNYRFGTFSIDDMTIWSSVLMEAILAEKGG